MYELLGELRKVSKTGVHYLLNKGSSKKIKKLNTIITKHIIIYINSGGVFFTFHVFGSCFKMLAVILFSE